MDHKDALWAAKTIESIQLHKVPYGDGQETILHIWPKENHRYSVGHEYAQLFCYLLDNFLKEQTHDQ